MLHFPSSRLFSDVLPSCTSCQFFIFSVWHYSLYSLIPRPSGKFLHSTWSPIALKSLLHLFHSLHFTCPGGSPSPYVLYFSPLFLKSSPSCKSFHFSGVTLVSPRPIFFFSPWSHIIGSLKFSENQLPLTPASTQPFLLLILVILLTAWNLKLSW
jgi:hypothetical protein